MKTPSFSHRTRAQMWEEVDKENFDLIVIGGGITGAGIARDAVYRGLSVALFERGDFAQETSSRSSKLIHGGLRYLEQYDFGLVFEAVQERYLLMKKLAPHLVKPLPFLIPVWDSSRHGMFMTHMGLTLYDGLALFRNYKNHRKLDVRRVEKKEPALNLRHLKGGFIYYDAHTDDGRLTLENLLSASEKGARIFNYTEVAQFLYQKDRVAGVGVRNVFTGEEKEVFARCVINATGPFSDRLLGKLKSSPDPIVRATKGVHIVLKKEDLPFDHAITFLSAVDGRVMFLIPWGDHVRVGTTDTADKAQFEGGAHREDIEYLLASLEGLSTGEKITEEKIVSAYAGWRPLIRDPEAKSESDISRTHEIFPHAPGLVTIAGGKLTTYRRMASETVDFAARREGLEGEKTSNTARIPLPGSQGLHLYHLEEDEALSTVYGMRQKVVESYQVHREDKEKIVDSLPYTKGEVRFFIEREMALTLKDVLCRRTNLALKTSDYGQKASEVVAEIMARELGWSLEQKEEEVENYSQYAAEALKWREH